MTVPEITPEKFTALAERAARLGADAAALADELSALAAEPLAKPVRVIAPSLLTVEDVAGSLSLCRPAMYELMRTGALNSVQIGVRRRIPVTAVDAYVAQLTGAARPWRLRSDPPAVVGRPGCRSEPAADGSEPKYGRTQRPRPRKRPTRCGNLSRSLVFSWCARPGFS